MNILEGSYKNDNKALNTGIGFRGSLLWCRLHDAIKPLLYTLPVSATLGDFGNTAMSLTWHIRQATLEDAEGLEKSMKSAYEPYQDRMEGARLPPMDVDYLSEIENYPTWVVESEGNILGGLIMIFEANSASIANIAINPRYHGQGIGGVLMKFAETKAKEKHVSELYLATHVLLEESLSLYLHLGWEEIDRDNAKVLMKKAI